MGHCVSIQLWYAVSVYCHTILFYKTDTSDLKIRRREARTATAAVEQDWGESRRARQKQKH